MPLEEIELPMDLDAELPAKIDDWLAAQSERIQRFQDRWDRAPIEQFVASDFALVFHTLTWIRRQPLLTSGNLFCEWGCGFAVVSCLADQLGWESIGIEAEADLIAQARQTVATYQANVDLWHGNFLPPGATELSADPCLPSLGHPEPCAYSDQDLEIDDFNLIFAYPWPGEGDFLESVFDEYAALGACMLSFRGPYELRLVRKNQ